MPLPIPSPSRPAHTMTEDRDGKAWPVGSTGLCFCSRGVDHPATLYGVVMKSDDPRLDRAYTGPRMSSRTVEPIKARDLLVIRLRDAGPPVAMYVESVDGEGRIEMRAVGEHPTDTIVSPLRPEMILQHYRPV